MSIALVHIENDRGESLEITWSEGGHISFEVITDHVSNFELADEVRRQLPESLNLGLRQRKGSTAVRAGC